MSDTRALVYVVDDDISAREGVAGLIRSAGIAAETFASGEELLAAPRATMPSCLVLDVNLPGVNGLDLQQELAKSGVRVPIIFLTGQGNIPMSVRALKAGAADFLTKPFDDEELLNAIRQCMTSYLEDELRQNIGDMVGESPAFPTSSPLSAAARSALMEPCHPGLNAGIRKARRSASTGWCAE